MVGEKNSGGGETSSDMPKPVETSPHVSILYTVVCLSKEHTMNRKVTFNPRPTVHVQYVWQFAYQQACKSEWEQYARDRDRFMRRIIESEHIINPILKESHRERVFTSLKQ